VAKKSDIASKLLAKIEPQHPLPEALPDINLVQQGLYFALRRRLGADAAKTALRKLTEAYPDWNELRVSQAQEINGVLQLGPKGVAVAREVREYLQEVFQRSHGMSLEFLRDDPQSTQRFVSILPYIGMAMSHHLLYLASNGELPVTPALVRVLDRLGLVSRTASVKKARVSIEPLIPDGRTLEFAYKFGEIATRWCDARKPLCHECVLVDDCKFGKKAFRDWKVQQERLELQRAREAARLAVLAKKEEERLRKEAEKQRKKAEFEAARRAKEAERSAAVAARKQAADHARIAKEHAKVEAQKQRDAEAARKKVEEAARKQAAAKKKLEEQKKAAAAKKKADVAAAAAKKKAAAAAKKKPAPKKKPAKKA
jgi:endonuclease III